ncbi:MAG: divergent polysaccharide deacetylase family protein [Thermodesulfobacteriota bacterium]
MAVVMALVRFDAIVLTRYAPVEKPSVRQVPGPPPQTPAGPPAVPVPSYPKLAIVIDDMGPDIGKLRELMRIGEPLTVAVMPYQRYSRATASEAYDNGLDVLMHLPMEPRDTVTHDPGKGALLVAMTPVEVRRQMEDDLGTVPHVIGVNNHMGSRFTEDTPHMREVLGFIRDKDLFFLDSRTSARSVGIRVAREMGVRNAGRNVFLDNTRDVGYIKGQLLEAVRIAKSRGSAIAIGHPYPETIQALAEALPGLDAAGVRAVRLSELIGHAGGPEPGGWR